MAGITWWTVAREAAARDLAAGGASAEEIARGLSRRFRRRVTANAVRCRARRARPPFPLEARGGRPSTE
ncbi:MAG TPA: hypothetical protein VMW52_06370 [Phycisphaerae bacterium]|nr:hypothetical protein [Phycisphaerae bacterium]